MYGIPKLICQWRHRLEFTDIHTAFVHNQKVFNISFKFLNQIKIRTNRMGKFSDKELISTAQSLVKLYKEEMIYQINDKNYDTDIILEENRIVKLKELLPEPWQKKFD
ncbi:hypothetical protein C4569_04015 [Candidatus Parcubacteria bacterium]|nr:MAG: hypothetical protein C4569_04015 [Candidatus Parcubacteria bacterium]